MLNLGWVTGYLEDFYCFPFSQLLRQQSCIALRKRVALIAQKLCHVVARCGCVCEAEGRVEICSDWPIYPSAEEL
jgi:hypothetical protein